MVLKKVVVVGSGSRVGRRLVSNFRESGINAVGARRQPDLANEIPFDICGPHSADDFDSIFGLPNTIVVLAALTPATGSRLAVDYLRSNVESPLRLALWARSRGVRFIFLSGGIVYRNIYEKGIDESSPRGYPGIGGHYCLSKIMAEQALELEQAAGLDLLVVRASSIYGTPVVHSGLIYRLITGALSTRRIVINEPVDSSFNLIHSNDLADAIAELELHGKRGFYNVAGESVQLRELAEVCSKVTDGTEVVVEPGRDKMSKPVGKYFLDLSCRKISNEVGWKPKVSLESGLAEISQEIHGTHF